MTAFEEVSVERRGALGIVTMNAPKRRNALSLTMRRELVDTFAELDADPALRAVVLTGAEGNFCAGGDLKSMMDVGVINGRERLAEVHQLVRQMVGMSVPLIGAVEGYAYGAGLSIAALCDIVVTAPDAKWCCAYAKVGLMPDLGATWILPKRIGVGRARMLAYTGRVIDGRQAADWGLADQVAGEDGVMAEALALAEEIARAAPLAVSAAKRAFGNPELSLSAALDAEADAQALLFGSDDLKEGRQAFFEKRTPDFKGQ
ncbi:MAG: enoyl-CoA hydratase-related protein [Pseudomonadota bacterium]